MSRLVWVTNEDGNATLKTASPEVQLFDVTKIGFRECENLDYMYIFHEDQVIVFNLFKNKENDDIKFIEVQDDLHKFKEGEQELALCLKGEVQ